MKRRGLPPHLMRHPRFDFDNEAFEREWRVVEEVRKVDATHHFVGTQPDRPRGTRRGSYWSSRRRIWAGRRFRMEGFRLRLADYQHTRERIAFAVTLPARRAGRLRRKQADRGVVRRRREAEFLHSHLNEE